jgi:hypothetical protein
MTSQFPRYYYNDVQYQQQFQEQLLRQQQTLLQQYQAMQQTGTTDGSTSSAADYLRWVAEKQRRDAEAQQAQINVAPRAPSPPSSPPPLVDADAVHSQPTTNIEAIPRDTAVVGVEPGEDVERQKRAEKKLQRLRVSFRFVLLLVESFYWFSCLFFFATETTSSFRSHEDLVM